MADEVAIYGLLAEFESAEKLLEAAHRVRSEGYRHIDGFSSFPVEGLFHALGQRSTSVPFIVLVTGAISCLGGFFMQWYANTIDYPLNIGGRPLNSWPAFIPVTFELTILGASLAALAGMLILNRLPCPYHPVFNAPPFHRASLDKFFLCILATDSKFDREQTRQFLQGLRPTSISEVAP